VVAANLNGYTGRNVKVRLLGGDLMIRLHKNGHVYMTGLAVEVFEGVITV
jgi:diaminopimelate epimerase